jgi:hypothetical protein
LLLNVVSGRIAQTAVITDDGANVSQAITYCAALVADDLAANDGTAEHVAETINEGRLLPAGVVPLSTPNIAYRNPRGADVPAHGELAFSLDGLRPNPARSAGVVAFTLDQDADVKVEILDVVGRRIAAETWSGLGVGAHAVPLAASARLRAGVYTVRLSHAGRVVSARFVRVN